MEVECKKDNTTREEVSFLIKEGKFVEAHKKAQMIDDLKVRTPLILDILISSSKEPIEARYFESFIRSYCEYKVDIDIDHNNIYILRIHPKYFEENNIT